MTIFEELKEKISETEQRGELIGENLVDEAREKLRASIKEIGNRFENVCAGCQNKDVCQHIDCLIRGRNEACDDILEVL